MSANNMTTREADEIVLRFLELRTDGFNCSEVGAKLGYSAGYVRAASNRVVNDDMGLHDDMISFCQK